MEAGVNNVSVLNLLPNETIVAVLLLLPPRDILRCRLVDRRTKLLVDSTPALEYKLKLFLTDLTATDPSGECDISRALASLENRESRWTSYRPLAEQEVKHADERVDLVDISGEFMARSAPDALYFDRLNQGHYENYPEHWCNITDTRGVARIAVCAEQDLVVLTRLERDVTDLAIIGLTVTLTTLRTGAQHPAASSPTLAVELPAFELAHHKISINGDLLAIMVSGVGFLRQTELFVWDWRTSVLRFNAYHTSVGVSSFEFLNDRFIVVPVVGAWDSLRGRDAALCIFDCRDARPGRHTFFDFPRAATLRLPSVADGAFYDQIHVVADRIVRSTGHNFSFVPNPAMRIVAIQLKVLHSANAHANNLFQNSTFCLFVHAGALVDLCTLETSGPVMRWDEWAAQTRLIRTLGDESFWLGRNISHNRTIVSEIRQGSGMFPPLDYVIYDFPSAPAFRHAVQTMDEQSQGPWRYVTDPTVISDRSIFRSNVVTSLPYRKVPSGYWRMLGPSDGGGETHVYLSGNCLLAKKRNSPWRVQAFS